MINWPEGTTVVVLACKGGGLAKIANGRFLVAKCDRKRCRVPGEHTWHIWDIETGRCSDHMEDPLPSAGTPPGGSRTWDSVKSPRD